MHTPRGFRSHVEVKWASCHSHSISKEASQMIPTPYLRGEEPVACRSPTWAGQTPEVALQRKELSLPLRSSRAAAPATAALSPQSRRGQGQHTVSPACPRLPCALRSTRAPVQVPSKPAIRPSPFLEPFSVCKASPRGACLHRGFSLEN